MSHDLFTLNDKVQSYTAEKAPWHMQGLTTDKPLKSLAELQSCGILDGDYCVETINDPRLDGLADKRVLCWQGNDILDEDTGDVITHKPLVVSDFVTEKYKLITLRQMTDLVQPLVDSGDLEIVTAGMIAQGSKAYFTYRIPSGSIQLPDSPIESLVNMLCDYRKAANVNVPSNLRTVCSNTFHANLSAFNGSDDLQKVFPRITHKGDVSYKLDDARKALEHYVLGGMEAAQVYRRMSEREITLQEYNAFLDMMFPLTDADGEKLTGKAATMAKNRRECFKAAALHETNRDLGNTVWRLFNAVTYGVDHTVKHPNTGETLGSLVTSRTNDNRSAAEARFDLTQFGAGAKLKADAWQWAVSLVS